MCNVLKLAHRPYLLMLTEAERRKLLAILDSFIEAYAQRQTTVYAGEYQTALKIHQALREPDTHKKVEVGK